MAIFKFTSKKSFGGRSSRFQWSNTYFVRTNVDLADPVLKEVANRIIEAEQVAHYDSVHFMGVHIKQHAENPLNKPPKRHVRVKSEARGSRILQGNLAPMEIVLEVEREATEGRNGVLLYRGCLTEDDLESTADNSYRIAVPAIFTTGGVGNDTLIEKLNAPLPDGIFVMPNEPGVTVQTSRDITRHTIGGVAIVQTTRRRTSIQTDKVKAAQREINLLARRAAKLLAGGAVAALFGSKLTAFRSLATAALAIYQAMAVEDQAQLTLPEFFGSFTA